MKKFVDLNGRTVGFTDNRTPRVVLRYNSAPNISEKLTETSFPFKTTIQVQDIIKVDQCLPALSITFNTVGATINFTLPTGVFVSTIEQGYLIQGFTTAAQWNTIVNNATVNAPADFQGSLVYTVELYWFEPVRKSISHTTGIIIPLGVLNVNTALTASAKVLYSGKSNIISTFGLSALKYTDGEADLTASFSLDGTTKIFDGLAAFIDFSSNLEATGTRIKSLESDLLTNFNYIPTASPLYRTTYLSNTAEPFFYDQLTERNISALSPRLTGISDNQLITHTMEVFPSELEFVDNFRVDFKFKDAIQVMNVGLNNAYGVIPGTQIVWSIANFTPRVLARSNVTTNSLVPVTTTNSYDGEIIAWNDLGTKFVTGDPFWPNVAGQPRYGRLRIYSVSPAGAITLDTTITGTVDNEAVGWSAAFSGTNRLVYSKDAADVEVRAGQVRILEFNGSVWNDVGSLTNPSPNAIDNFGYLLAGNRDTTVGNRYIVMNYTYGADPDDSSLDFFQGSTYKFSKTITGSGIFNKIIADKQFNLIAQEGTPNLYNWDGNDITNPDGGNVVAISPNGTYIITLTNEMRIWKRTGTNTWEFIDRLIETFTAQFYEFEFTDDENHLIIVYRNASSGYVKKYTLVDADKWVYNNTTKTITISGNKPQINSMLSNLYMTTELVNGIYELNYKLTASDPNVVYTRKLEWLPFNTKVTMATSSSISCDNKRIRGSISNLLTSANLTANGIGGKTDSGPITLAASFAVSCANSFLLFGNSTVPLRGESFTNGLSEFWFAGISPNTVQDNGIQVIFVSDIIDNDLLLMPAGFSYTNTVNNVSFFDDLCHKTYSTGDVTPYQFRAPQTGSYISKTLIFDKNPNRYRVSSSTTGTGNNTTQTVSNVSSVAGDLFISIVVGKMPNVPINSYTMPAGFKLIDIRREGNLFMAIAGWTSNITGTVGFTTSWTFNTSQPINNWRQTFMALR